MRELVLGGARSGKSGYALAVARQFDDAVTWIATAEPRDDEMRDRIARHRQERPAAWETIEEPLSLSRVLTASARPGRCIVVDCLTLWLANLLLADAPARLQSEKRSLLDVAVRLPGRIVLIANEVGWGIVPDNALARRFRDEAGRLNQEIAAVCEQVTLVVAGIPTAIRTSSARGEG